MLKNIKLDLSVTNPILNLKDSIIDEISNSKIVRVKLILKQLSLKAKAKTKT